MDINAPAEIDTITGLLSWIESRMGTTVHESEIPKIDGAVLSSSHDLFTTWRTEGGWWMNLTEAGKNWLKEAREKELPQTTGSILGAARQYYEALRWMTAGFLTLTTGRKRWSH